MTVLVTIDGSGTYPANTAVYKHLPREQVPEVISNWLLQDDVIGISVLPEPEGGGQ